MHCSLLQIVAETVTEVGDPKVAIYEAVEKLNIQLLVLGSHGRGAIKRLVPKVTICICISLYLSSLITFNYKVFLQNYCACMCVWELVSFRYFFYFQIRKLWSIYTEDMVYCTNKKCRLELLCTVFCFDRTWKELFI